MSKYFPLAAEIADSSRCRQRHGALLVYRGQVIVAGPNLLREDPRYAEPRLCSVHAEENVLRNVDPRYAKGGTLIVVRINKSGKLLPSAPCKRCEGAIERAGINRVVHS